MSELISRPEVSVVIPCFNAASTLPLQLQALATQTGAPSFEVLVVDNRSTDGLSALVREWTPRAPFALRLVRAHAHQGASYARNVGIRESQAPYLMFCDADDAVSEFWVDHGRRCFETTPVWSGSAILLPDDVFELDLSGIRRAMGDDSSWIPPVFEQEDQAFPILMGGNFGATKSALMEVGGFDQSLPSVSEDNDLGFRLRCAGFSVPVAKTVRIAYRGKWDLATRRRLAYRSALAHALIASRYRAWSVSPHKRWLRELSRTLGASAKMATQRRSADWPGWVTRLASALGLAYGNLKYHRLRLVPRAQLGIGLEPPLASEGETP